MERRTATIVVLTLVGLFYVVAALVRPWGARRRRTVAEHGAKVRIPARLRGITLLYPSYWQPGRLDTSTAIWRPRGRWGLPISLAGARARATERPRRMTALPWFALDDVVVTCEDQHGRIFQLAVVDDRDVRLVVECLTGAAAAAGEPAPVTAFHGRLRALRNRIPLLAVVLLVVGVLGLGYLGMPLLGLRQVDAVVLHTGSAKEYCEVRWTDPVRDTGGHISLIFRR